MSVKQTGQFSFAEALMPASVGRNDQLERLDGLVRWYRFEKVLSGLRDDGPGRAAWPVLVMFKSLLLQALYGLSDRELEAALGDRLLFRRFVGLSMQDAVPDHTTLNRFRNGLVGAGVLEKLFGELDRQLDQAGMILRRGTMLDATLIEAASAPPRTGRDGQERPGRDTDAAFAKRSGKPGSTYGYKAHVGVDEGSGLIRSLITTPANINDTTPADDLILGDEKVVWGDAAYHTHARQSRLREAGVKPRLMRRPNKHHPDLPPRLKRYNQLIARRRAAVETTFATLKNRMGLRAIRYVGLTKARAQMILAAMAFNLRRWSALATT